MRKTISLLALCAALGACGNQIQPYSEQAFAKFPCLMAANSSDGDAGKPWVDPWWFGSDGGIGGIDAAFPYLHVSHPHSGCALQRTPISHEAMEDAVID